MKYPFFLPADLRWKARAERELERLRASRAEGLARLINALNRAQRLGDSVSMERARQELERFLTVNAAMTDLVPQIIVLLTPPAETEPSPAQIEPLHQPVSQQPGEALELEDTYLVSSATIAQAYSFLTQHLPGTGQEPEWMLAVTGLRQGKMRTLEHLIEVKLANQSLVQASFDMKDFMRVAIALYEHGQALHAVFHSHRFNGPPSPSGTDDRLQQILEEGGYPAIQAVFSEDGYVRFFARRRRFAVQVYGKGVIPVDGHKNLYRIVHFGTLPHPTTPAQSAGRGDSLRSLPASSRR